MRKPGYRLYQFQFCRMMKQKVLWVYLIALGFMILSSSLDYLKNPRSDLAMHYAGGLFPLTGLHNQVSIIGPLFLALAAAIMVNGEKTSGIIRQPLLSGISKGQLLNAKILSMVSVVVISVLTIEALSFFIGYWAWGSRIFDQWSLCVAQIALTIVPLTVTGIGLILLSLYLPNMAVTLCVAFFIALLDNLVSQFFAPVVSRFSYLYYAYAFCSFNARPVEGRMIPGGLLLCLITGIVFYILAYRRIYKMPL